MQCTRRNSPNRRGFLCGVVGPPTSKQQASRTFWNVRPQRVTVPYTTAALLVGGTWVGRVTWNPDWIYGDHPVRLNTTWWPIVNSVWRLKDEKNPVEGRIVNLKPCAYKRSEHYGSLLQCVTACLLHNDPASYRLRPG